MAKRKRDVPDETVRPFTPSFPFFLVYANDTPVVGNDGGMQFVMACASLELGELVGSQFEQTEPDTQIELQRIVNRAALSAVAQLLMHQGVTHMSWNATRHSRVINVVGLADFVID